MRLLCMQLFKERKLHSIQVYWGTWVFKIALILLTLVTIKMCLHHVLKEDVPLWNQDIDFETANIRNDTGSPRGCYLVPNLIHFIRFGGHEFTFTHMVCVLAAFKNQKPDKIIFHYDKKETFSGPYWDILRAVKGLSDIIELNYIEEPQEVFGQRFPLDVREYHASDISRIRILMIYGGIYLDNDSYLIKSLNDFRKYEMTLNWDEDQFLGNQVLIAHKDARFLKLWLESYRGSYRGDLWYYNAGKNPTRTILWKRPELVHRVRVLFGADVEYITYVFMSKWSKWREFYAMHLLMNHQYLLKNISSKATFPVVFNEYNIGYYPNTFREMVYDVYDVGNLQWPKEYKD